MKKFFLFLVLALLIISPLAASAQQSIPNHDETVLRGGPGGVVRVIKVITNWLFTILLALAVVFILLAAFKYLFSGGGDEVGKAHKMLLYAAVAVAVAFLAKGIVFVVEELVTSGGGGGGGSSTQIRYNNDNVNFRIDF